MGAFGWGTDRSVGEWLFEEGYRFDFFQAVRLLEMMFSTDVRIGESAHPQRESVRFTSQVDLAFPSTDIAEITHSDPASGGPPITMSVNFMGLAGHLGPLPEPYTEVIMDRDWQRDTAFPDFLDIFNHRLLSILYRVRKQHHIGLDTVPPDQSHVASYLYALAGMGTLGLKGLMDINDRALLRYTGLLAQKPRSAAGLEVLLQDYFNVPVRLRQLVGRWRALSDQQITCIAQPQSGGPLAGHNNRLAQNNRLGQNVVLGTRVWHQAGQFSVHLGPLSLPSFFDFLPNGSAHRALSELTQFYVNREVDFNIVLQLKEEEVLASRLSTLIGSRLGWTSWLTTPPQGLVDDLSRGEKQPADDPSASTPDDVRDEDPPPPAFLPPELKMGWTSWLITPAEAVISDVPPAEASDEAPHAERSQTFEITVMPSFLPPELQKLRIPLFADLLPDQVHKVRNAMQVHRLPEGIVIAREGDPADSFFIINTGSVRELRAEQERGEVLLATHVEGNYFGETTLQKDKRRPTTFVTAEPCEILELTHEKLYQMMTQDPAIERAVEVYHRMKSPDEGAHRHAQLAQKLRELRSPFFAKLSMEGLYEIAEKLTLHDLAAGAVVVRQGDPGKALYIVSEGTAQVDVRLPDGRSTTQATLHRGDSFGELELLYSIPYNATLTTTRPAEVIELTHAKLMWVSARFPPIEHALRVFYHRRFAALTRARYGA